MPSAKQSTTPKIITDVITRFPFACLPNDEGSYLYVLSMETDALEVRRFLLLPIYILSTSSGEK